MPSFQHFCGFFFFQCLFEMAPKHSTEVLSGVPRCRKTEISLTVKIHILAKPCSGMSCSAVGLEIKVNEAAIYTK